MERKICAILAFLLFVISVHAAVTQTVIDGVNYVLRTDGETITATVVAGDQKYVGHVVIPDSVVYSGTKYVVTAIGDSAFCYCYDLQSVTIGNQVTSIGDYAFLGCKKLKRVDFSQRLTSIGHYAFNFCFGLESIDIPNSVTSLGWCCFAQCTNAASLKIGSGVTTIPANAFELCRNLTSVVIPENVSLIKPYAFTKCDRLASVTIRSESISIEAYVFKDCTALDSLIFAESVSTIRNCSFSLGSKTDVICLAKYPPVCEGDTSPFAGVSPYCVLYVPKGRSADYRVAKGWTGQFRAIDEIEVSDQAARCDVNGDGVVDISDATLVIQNALSK